MGGVAFVAFCFTSVRVKYCKPPIDLGKMLINITPKFTGLELKSLR
jgi:hypothetical protein